MTSHKEIRKEQDPMELIKAIKGVTYNFCDTQFLPASIWEAAKSMCNCRQDQNEDAKRHHDRFRNRAKVLYLES